MDKRWRYRLASVAGTVGLVSLAIALANLAVVQDWFARVPYFGRPAPAVLSTGELAVAITTAVAVALGAFWPLFKPRPRRILDAIIETQRRVVLTMVALAALGYFNYTYRLPRSTVMLATVFLLVALPAYMVLVRRQPQTAGRALLVGDDPDAMAAILEASEMPVVGYVAPPGVAESTFAPGSATREGTPDGPSATLERIGGFARIEDVIATNDFDTVLLGFASPDRAEFFGTLAACHEHGLGVKIHRDHAETVLTARSPQGELVDVDLEPWDLQDRVLKRLFDVGFAAVGLALLSPAILVAALAIKLDDGGPILYGQERTAEFGDTFTVYKFRTMRVGEESSTPGDGRERVTGVGRFLRRTHLDEIPQLWAILTGRMSVVGPRATWTDEESHLEAVVSTWRKRWFVKPGLTGLAQIHAVDSTDPAEKLRHDLQYIQRQSFQFDIQIVVRQLWTVWLDVWATVRGRHGGAPEPTTGEEAAGEERDSAGDTESAPPVATDGAHTKHHSDRRE